MKRLCRRSRCAGFTMIELMVVVLIVAVLAAVAIPLYGKYIKSARITEATGKMGEIITSCRAAAQSNTDANDDPQWPAPGGAADVSSTDNFDYAINTTGVENAETTPLVVTGTGKARMAGATVAITVPNIAQNASAPIVTLP